MPGVGAAAVNVTVPVTLLLAITDVLLNVRELKVTGDGSRVTV